ncbi:hypothetical protein BY996DRAFT_6565864 [Phakopsora pachyrhizi]|nr:hypothetical protein BY996DRAFT_6565864 [Phakopsora pachyrhizi]
MRGWGLKLKSLLAHQPAPHQPPGQTRYYQRIKSGSTENDIDRHQQEQNEDEDDSDFELDEMEFYHYSRWPALGSKFDLEEDEKRKQASKMEIRRSNGEAWLQVPRQRSANRVVSNSTCQSGLELPEPIRSIELDREIFECEALPRIWLLHPDNSISHEDSNGLNLLMIEGLTKDERTQAKGLVRIGGFDPTYPTKKRRNSRTIDQELKLPKNESSSSGLDDQQTENATEETTLIPQIKKGTLER